MSSRRLDKLCIEPEKFHSKKHVQRQSNFSSRLYSCSQQHFDKNTNKVRVHGTTNKIVAGSLASTSGESSISNLNQFLKYTTPVVSFQYLPKTCLWEPSLKRWKPLATDFIPFYTLGDLWDSFGEWSAYGAGVPLDLKGAESVVQYYVPYLSALQLYSRSGIMLSFNHRTRGEESDASDSDFKDISSDGSSDAENYQVLQHKGVRRCSRNTREQECSFRLSDHVHNFSSLIDIYHKSSIYGDIKAVYNDETLEDEEESGRLLFEYFERAAPCSRVPLIDKISDLTRGFSLLKSLRSVELLPSSWLSIAWYPIYRIPTGPTLRDLAACFLTFHSISTPLQGVSDGPWLHSDRMLYDFQTENVALRSFGLASYKLRGAFWTSVGSLDRQIASKLQFSADLWLKQRQVQHPDFDFFLSHSRIGRH